MGTKYVSQTQSGYNALPPPDDGSTGVTNLITWSGLKTKLADPTLTLAQNINSALTNALDFSSRITAVNDTATSADHMKTIECTAALTAKVPTSASVGAGFIVSYKNTSASNVTIGLVTATDTLDGVVNGTFVLLPQQSLMVKSNLAGTGYYSISGFFGAAGGGAISCTTLTASGATSLQATTLTTINGTKISLGNNSISTNIAIGTGTLVSVTSGANNCGFGNGALGAITNGVGNIAIGINAGTNISSSNNNIAIGSAAYGVGNGAQNIALGTTTLQSSTGSSNTCIGYGVSVAAGAGSNNTSVGNNSLAAVTSGGNNTAIGDSAGSTLTTGSNNTLIGNAAAPTAVGVSNEFTLGNASVATLRCQQTTITALSDERDKKDIAPIPLGLDFINTLKPVKFTWNARDGSRVDIPDCGFIAQDLKSAQENVNAKEWLNLVYESNPEKLEATAGRILPILVKAIQELSAQFEQYKKEHS